MTQLHLKCLSRPLCWKRPNIWKNIHVYQSHSAEVCFKPRSISGPCTPDKEEKKIADYLKKYYNNTLLIKKTKAVLSFKFLSIFVLIVQNIYFKMVFQMLLVCKVVKKLLLRKPLQNIKGIVKVKIFIK